MIQKLLSLLLLACPLMLSAGGPIPKNAQQSPDVPRKVFVKEHFTREEKGLVNKVWTLVKENKFKTLQHMMTSDFLFLSNNGSNANRTTTLASLQGSPLSNFQILFLNLIRSKDCIVATYTLLATFAATPTSTATSSQMSVFQKSHGTWKWKSLALYSYNNS